MASKRRDAPHLVAPIRRYATSKVSSVSAAADADQSKAAADVVSQSTPCVGSRSRAAYCAAHAHLLPWQ